jgi:hypothetical protein
MVLDFAADECYQGKRSPPSALEASPEIQGPGVIHEGMVRLRFVLPPSILGVGPGHSRAGHSARPHVAWP